MRKKYGTTSLQSARVQSIISNRFEVMAAGHFFDSSLLVQLRGIRDRATLEIFYAVEAWQDPTNGVYFIQKYLGYLK